MDTLDGLKGKLGKVQMALANPEVKYIIEILNDIGKRKLVQDLTSSGEEAVRALGFQQGIGIVNILPEVLEAEIKHIEAIGHAQIKAKLGLTKLKK